jgi:hypothetical protein
MAMDFLTSDASFEEKVIYALSALNTKMEGLVGNGQPGKISRIEADIADLKSAQDRASGRHSVVASIWAGIIALIVSIVAAFVRKY